MKGMIDEVGDVVRSSRARLVTRKERICEGKLLGSHDSGEMCSDKDGIRLHVMDVMPFTFYHITLKSVLTPLREGVSMIVIMAVPLSFSHFSLLKIFAFVWIHRPCFCFFIISSVYHFHRCCHEHYEHIGDQHLHGEHDGDLHQQPSPIP
ncbi:hypothetical protein QVD17_23878 [Tagetes erecta]|uniref:Uncharacterized protein n=1 Tax=Tagetes erecta TaxID=13708 RepID=A0AAD8NUJ0_TARER|nr:hypothetical protein QVD17_23878 [Tagetes erecta]